MNRRGDRHNCGDVGQPFHAAGEPGFPARRPTGGSKAALTGTLESVPYSTSLCLRPTTLSACLENAVSRPERDRPPVAAPAKAASCPLRAGTARAPLAFSKHGLSAVILAGGQSRRMGRDKAWLEFEGHPLLTRALDTVRDSGITEIYISGRAGADYSSTHCPILLDREPGCGPLAGIERALEASQAPLLLVLAVDLPRMTAAFLRQLAGRCDSRKGAIPLVRGQLEPLAAIYPIRCHPLARDGLRSGRRAVREFAEACRRAGALRTFKVSRAHVPCFDNWNTPSDISASSS